VSYNSGTKTAQLQPTSALAAGASYTAQVSGVKDLAGNTLAATYSWSYTTAAAPLADTTPPMVNSTTPANAATNVGTGASVTATFSEALDTTSITGANFTLTGPGGTVGANLSYNPSTNTVLLQPTSALAAGASYTAQISGVKDLAGNTLVGTYSWSFTTAAAPPPGSSFTFTPEVDTYVSQASPTTSNATKTELQGVGGSAPKEIYLRFNVSGLPAGASVSSVKLRLYVSNDSTSGGVVQGVSKIDWAEGMLWADKPAIDGPVFATMGAVPISTLIEVNLGAAINGNGKYSFAITLPASVTNTVGYASRENSTAANRPQLVITTQ
jgi:hypothetical protein